ncbi:copper amine oxidase [Alkalicoccus halolimnae]|uniref:Copper amine oxidase n=1 Tax=Alkalicoccus halolimnae TaxID=1667239 RepID=A0A5C7FE27_9BACI|nr:copper amine oxidase [Alkalicoccus halolimnae]TXF83342.1 copper amine oxidase [Alkalicoccus halolimnae]
MSKMKKAVLSSCALLVMAPSAAMAADHGEHAEGHGEASVTSPAADFRADLDQLFSEHFALTVAFMQKAHDGADDAAQAGAALDQNTAELTAAIDSIYGAEGAEEFERIWQSHINFFGDMVVAEVEGDEEARTEAETNLENYVQEFSSFLDSATEGNLPQEAGEEAITAHVADVTDTFDAYADGEFQETYENFRGGFHHMFDIGVTLGGAIVEQMPEEFDNTEVSTPAADLRSDLNHLLSEHFFLAVFGMQKGFDGADDFDEAQWALDENTADLTAAIDSLYGEEGAEAFEPIWQSHINFFGDMTAAAVEGDEEAREEADENLADYVVEFSAFLDEATEGGIPQEAGEEAISAHVADVTNTFDAYVAGNFEQTWSEEFRHGFHHMFVLGEVLSNAFVSQMPEQFAGESMPEEMPATGLGGTASNTTLLWAMTTAFVAAAGAFLYGRKRINAQG